MTDLDASAASSPAREYPAAPVVAVAAIIIHEGRVALVRRGKAPAKGAWSLPGGALELGETLADGLRREVLEETGLRVQPVRLVGAFDRILHDPAGVLQFHYVLLDWLCTVESGTLHPGSDALAAAWARSSELSSDPPYHLEASLASLLSSIAEDI